MHNSKTTRLPGLMESTASLEDAAPLQNIQPKSPAGKTERTFYLSDDVHRSLELLELEHGKSASVLIERLLRKHLPELEVMRRAG